ncbi:thioesterase II family protein [Streptomyces sp. NPDC056255]|uniref:AsuC15 n=1 Tax=Streptomyces nodosus subsp. asukaensis TaxID=222892 RepID=D7P5X6_STRNS|nr:AsuC15 [Streptomyces nodosus subsp. asukaensis]
MAAGTRARTDGIRNPWIRQLPGQGAAGRVRLICLPYAGGGAGVYRDWLNAGRDMGVEVLAVRPPGREQRFGEPAFDDARSLAACLAVVLEPYLDGPYALYGHSVGSVVGLALAHELARSPRSRQPLGLFVGAGVAPEVLRPQPEWSGSDAELTEWLRRTGGTPGSVLARPGLVARVLPALRADLAMAAGYRKRPGERLTVPIRGFAGAADPMATAAAMAGWGAETTARFQLSQVPGGHFFLAESGRQVLARIAEQLHAAA